MNIFLAGMARIIPALSTSNLTLFIAATLIAGAGQGIAVTASIRGLLHASTSSTGPRSSPHLLSYNGAAIPSLISGQLSHTFTLFQSPSATGYSPSSRPQPPSSLRATHHSGDRAPPRPGRGTSPE